MIQNLDIYLWNQKVGSLVTYKERYSEKICFYFDRAFLASGYDIAPLRASVNSVSVKNGLPVYAEAEKLFGGLPSFIADSLPDHWGNRVFNEWAKAHNISTRNLSALDRLAYIGRRGMGADGVWHTAPAYDYTFSVDPSAPGYMNRHCMTINNKNSDIERSDLLELAKRYNIKGADAIIEKVISVLGNYKHYAEAAGVSPYWIHKIKEEIGYRIDNMTDVSRLS